jgi:cation diffusion facilitator family transporter
LLRDDGHHHHDQAHAHEHDHHHHHGKHHGHDSNLRGAYLHVLADAMTSVLAIGALLVAKYWQVTSVDPLVGIVGALVIMKWSVGLVRTTSRELLDADVPPAMLDRVREALASVPDTKVVDLHVWRLGPNHHAVIVSVVSDNAPEVYKKALASEAALSHVTVEVNPRRP